MYFPVPWHLSRVSYLWCVRNQTSKCVVVVVVVGGFCFYFQNSTSVPKNSFSSGDGHQKQHQLVLDNEVKQVQLLSHSKVKWSCKARETNSSGSAQRKPAKCVNAESRVGYCLHGCCLSKLTEVSSTKNR